MFPERRGNPHLERNPPKQRSTGSPPCERWAKRCRRGPLPDRRRRLAPRRQNWCVGRLTREGPRGASSAARQPTAFRRAPRPSIATNSGSQGPSWHFMGERSPGSRPVSSSWTAASPGWCGAPWIRERTSIARIEACTTSSRNENQQFGGSGTLSHRPPNKTPLFAPRSEFAQGHEMEGERIAPLFAHPHGLLCGQTRSRQPQPGEVMDKIGPPQ